LLRTLFRRALADGRTLLPAAPRPGYGGRRRTVPDRRCFAAIVYMARTSTPWRLLPVQALGCGSPATAWRRLNEWAKAGCSSSSIWRCWTGLVWRAGWTGRARASTRPVCAPNAGDHVGANPVDRGKPGSKIHLACEGSRLPLTAVVTAANISDVSMLVAVLDDVPAVLTPAGRRRAGAASLASGAGAVVAELLAVAAGAVGSGLGPVLRVRAAGMCPGLPQAALAASKREPMPTWSRSPRPPGSPAGRGRRRWCTTPTPGSPWPTRAPGLRAAGRRPAR
jgi:putative transposase of IS4/5 family DUF4096